LFGFCFVLAVVFAARIYADSANSRQFLTYYYHFTAGEIKVPKLNVTGNVTFPPDEPTLRSDTGLRSVLNVLLQSGTTPDDNDNRQHRKH
jgi:hypothetical protein